MKRNDKGEVVKKFTRHGMSYTNFYSVFYGMRDRCNNKNSREYRRYGGRGIKVCNRWSNFLNFKEDMYDEYQKHIKEFGQYETQIDRINNEKGYSKKNCQWATREEQYNNTRSIGKYNFMGKRMSLYEISKIVGLRKKTIYTRIKRGWDLDEAILTPVQKCGYKKKKTINL